MVQEVLFKDFSKKILFLALVANVRQSGTVFAILAEVIMGELF